MTDTPCVDGCGQDAATIERLRERLAKVEALAEGVGEGNLKTSHLRAMLETNIADDYERGRVHAEDDAYRHLRVALAPQSAADAPEAPGQPGRGEGAARGRTAALCIGCGWCCQSTPRERRGEAHQGCH